MIRSFAVHSWKAIFIGLAGLSLMPCVRAQEGFVAPSMPVIGSPNTVTADPAIPRPHTQPCVVSLFTNLGFTNFSPKAFAYTPPSGCQGTWAKVILEGDFNVTAGRQFDRTAEIFIGNTNVYYGTTPEPSRNVSPTWHVERDLTEYSALLKMAQPGEVILGNVVNSTFTGIISGSADIQFYPGEDDQRGPRVADAVLPLHDAPGGAVILATTASTLARTLNLPTNIESAYLDVITQSQSSDEFWYTCVPDDVANELFSCPGTGFREAEITMDGQPAGVAPVYPWIYTGGIDPFLWRPIPGVQTLNFVPYRVDLTPFAGVLSNGQPHTISLNVYNADHYFRATATLLLYLDHGAEQVTGEVTTNTIGTGPNPVVTESLTMTNGVLSGPVAVTSARQFTLAGYANTSHGRVDTKIVQSIDFSNQQQFIVSATNFVQNITQTTNITSTTTRKEGSLFFETKNHLSYPLIANFSQPTNPDGSSSLLTMIQQQFHSKETSKLNGVPIFSSRFSNIVAPTDTLFFDANFNVTGHQGEQSSQKYFFRNSFGRCYSRTIATVDDLLTKVTDGEGCGRDDEGDDNRD